MRKRHFDPLSAMCTITNVRLARVWSMLGPTGVDHEELARVIAREREARSRAKPLDFASTREHAAS
jgi:hypothetical protein